MNARQGLDEKLEFFRVRVFDVSDEYGRCGKLAFGFAFDLEPVVHLLQGLGRTLFGKRRFNGHVQMLHLDTQRSVLLDVVKERQFFGAFHDVCDHGAGRL